MPLPGASPTPAPVLPKNVAGAPIGPGPTPVASPGAGAGNQAASNALVKAVMPALHKALMAFDVGSKEYKAVMRAISSLSPIFGEPQGGNLVPPAIMQMAQAAKGGGMGGSPVPGAAPTPAPAPAPDLAA